MSQEKRELEQARERIGELEAEIERQGAAMRGMQRALGGLERVRAERDRLRAERDTSDANARLAMNRGDGYKAERDRLRAALVDVLENSKFQENFQEPEERILRRHGIDPKDLEDLRLEARRARQLTN